MLLITNFPYLDDIFMFYSHCYVKNTYLVPHFPYSFFGIEWHFLKSDTKVIEHLIFIQLPYIRFKKMFSKYAI